MDSCLVPAAVVVLQSLIRCVAETNISNETTTTSFPYFSTPRIIVWDNGTSLEIDTTRRQIVFIMGMTFLGCITLFVVFCCTSCCIDSWREFRASQQREPRQTSAENNGVVNLAFIGDNSRSYVADDRPPDYSTILAQDGRPTSSSQQSKVGLILERIWRKSAAKPNEQPFEDIPPSYESVVNLK